MNTIQFNKIYSYLQGDRLAYILVKKVKNTTMSENKLRFIDVIETMPEDSFMRINVNITKTGAFSLQNIAKLQCVHENGCGKSMPLSIWLEQDVLDCIEKYKIPIAEIYKKGAKRTGCMFCGYGCQFPHQRRTIKIIMKPYGREKHVSGGNNWKIDFHIRPKRKFQNWWWIFNNLILIIGISYLITKVICKI